MNGPVTEGTRVFAAQLARRFARDAELAMRLADAQARLMRANDRLWWGLHPDGLAAVYGEHPTVVDMAFAENRSEVLGAPDPLAAIQQVHWTVREAFVDYQSAAEERRQLAADIGELLRQFVEELVAAGWSQEQARDANVPRARSNKQSTEQGVTMGTTLIPPFRTARTTRDQAIEALGEANRVRLRRASLLRWICGQSSAQSHERAAELVLEPDRSVCSMLVLDLLGRVRQVGSAQAERMLSSADVPPTSTVGALTARQRAALAAVLRLRADQLSRCGRARLQR